LKLGRQLVGWIAAYALVLHAALAGVVAVGNGAPGFELCVAHPDGAPTPAQGQHQHEQCALHCAASLGPAAVALALIAFVFPPRQMGYAPVRRSCRASSFLCRAGRSRAPPHPA
jgi:hypothetical protein